MQWGGAFALGSPGLWALLGPLRSTDGRRTSRAFCKGLSGFCLQGRKTDDGRVRRCLWEGVGHLPKGVSTNIRKWGIAEAVVSAGGQVKAQALSTMCFGAGALHQGWVHQRGAGKGVERVRCPQSPRWGTSGGAVNALGFLGGFRTECLCWKEFVGYRATSCRGILVLWSFHHNGPEWRIGVLCAVPLVPTTSHHPAPAPLPLCPSALDSTVELCSATAPPSKIPSPVGVVPRPCEMSFATRSQRCPTVAPPQPFWGPPLPH